MTRMMIDIPDDEQDSNYHRLDTVAQMLGVTKVAVRLFAHEYGFPLFKFPLNRWTYLRKEDAEKLRQWRNKAIKEYARI